MYGSVYVTLGLLLNNMSAWKRLVFVTNSVHSQSTFYLALLYTAQISDS